MPPEPISTLRPRPNLVPVNQFSHVAAVIDTAGGVMQIYLNGNLVASRTTSGAMVANSVPVTIGLSDPGSNFGFKGLIDEPSVYNRALSQVQIQSIVSAGSVGKVAPVVVVNVAPTPAIQGFSSGLATEVLNFTASATDPSTVDQAAGFAYSVNWGDGSPVQAIAQTAGNGSGVSLSHPFTTAGTFTVTLSATDKDNGTGSISSTVTVLAVTSANLQTVINQQGSFTFQATTDAQAQSVTTALNGLSAQATPTTLTLNLGSGSYNDTTAHPPAGTTLVINGSGGTTTIVGHSPALVVTGGNVILSNMTLVTATDCADPPGLRRQRDAAKRRHRREHHGKPGCPLDHRRHGGPGHGGQPRRQRLRRPRPRRADPQRRCRSLSRPSATPSRRTGSRSPRPMESRMRSSTP